MSQMGSESVMRMGWHGASWKAAVAFQTYVEAWFLEERWSTLILMFSDGDKTPCKDACAWSVVKLGVFLYSGVTRRQSAFHFLDVPPSVAGARRQLCTSGVEGILV